MQPTRVRLRTQDCGGGLPGDLPVIAPRYESGETQAVTELRDVGALRATPVGPRLRAAAVVFIPACDK